MSSQRSLGWLYVWLGGGRGDWAIAVSSLILSQCVLGGVGDDLRLIGRREEEWSSFARYDWYSVISACVRGGVEYFRTRFSERNTRRAHWLSKVRKGDT
jgi:hypothetical protein